MCVGEGRGLFCLSSIKKGFNVGFLYGCCGFYEDVYVLDPGALNQWFPAVIYIYMYGFVLCLFPLLSTSVYMCVYMCVNVFINE